MAKAKTEIETPAVHHEEPAAGRRPMSFANWVGLLLLAAMCAFYLAFAIPEFMGIIGGRPLVFG